MNEFYLFFHIGIQHVMTLKGLDHLLFVVVLSLRYLFKDWKKLLLLITAFTIGHSLTLALSVFNIIHLSSLWVEFLIPVTIVLTAVSNLFVRKFVFKTKYPLIYFMALFFGLIHGLGFSNYLRSLLGRGSSIFVQLLAFNIGLEVGQLVIVIALLIIAFICVNIIKINRREYVLFLSGCILGVAIEMAVTRIPF